MEGILSDISASENVIMVRSSKGTDLSENLKKFTNLKSIYLVDLASTTHHDSADILLSCEIPDQEYTNEFLTHLHEMLKPGGKLMISNISERDKVQFSLIMKGFMNVKISDGIITANKPKFEMGSSAKLTVNASSSIWKLDPAVDEDLETIDPDDLLDEDDLIKPDPTSLRVCKTTGKRKACKDCSCGLAEELIGAQNGKVIDTTDAPKSSCGSCYLGDAFRCSSCPYLGMPAFKPGEKIQLLGNQLQADV